MTKNDASEVQNYLIRKQWRIEPRIKPITFLSPNNDGISIEISAWELPHTPNEWAVLMRVFNDTHLIKEYPFSNFNNAMRYMSKILLETLYDELTLYNTKKQKHEKQS